MKQLFLVLPLCFMFAVVANAQPTTCTPVVQQALDAVGQNCGELARNVACYGNFAARADFQQEMPVTTFSRPADVIELAMLNTVRVSPFDVERQEWGVVVMNTQADLPATLPGQGVVMLLLGDVQVTDASPERDDRQPMQTFYFSGGIGTANCEDAPSTVAIRSPENITVNLTINGLDITLGSMITLVDNQNSTMTITVHEGQMVAVASGTTVITGESVDVSLDATRTVNKVGIARPATLTELALNQPVNDVFGAVSSTEVTASATTNDNYVVQPGDSLFRIALENGTCVSEVARVNNIPPSQVRVISVGMELTIPDGSTCGALVNDVASPAQNTQPTPPGNHTEAFQEGNETETVSGTMEDGAQVTVLDGLGDVNLVPNNNITLDTSDDIGQINSLTITQDDYNIIVPEENQITTD